MKLTLFKQKLALPALLGVTEAAAEQRDALVARAGRVVSVTTPGEQRLAADVAVEIRTLVKGVQDAGLEFRRPMNDLAKQVKKVEDEHCAPLAAEQKRLERLLVDFAEQEARRVAEEERKRRAAFEAAEAERMRLRLEAEQKAAEAAAKGTKKAAREAEKLAAAAEQAAEAVQSVIAAPMPEASRADGVHVRKVLRWEATDLHALYKSRPEFVKLEARGSVIQQLCVPEMPNKPDGLRLWWENQGVTTRR